jgi:phosphatidyl-myo-inositol dimannoside synthase
MTDLSDTLIWVMAKGFAPDEGGQQIYAEKVAKAYARRRARVTIFTQTSAGPRIADYDGLRLIDVGPGKGVDVPFRWLAALWRERQREQQKPDFVHATTWRTAVPAMLCGLSMAVTFHGREFMYVRSFAFQLMRWVARKAAPLVTVSHYSAKRLTERLGGIAPVPLVAWNGVSLNPPVRIPTPDNVPLLFSLCRLEPRKNIAAAVRAAIMLAEQGYRFRYIVCGRGPELEAITKLVCDAGMAEIIDVAGYVDDERALSLYAQADIFIHPQLAIDGGRDFEGFGIAIADAMVAGCAVIIGEEGGAAELVEDGLSGVVVDGRNDVQIVEAIKRLLDNPHGRREMARRGQARAADRMQWDIHVQIILPTRNG